MPIAVISAVSRGALRWRSGRYATRSIVRAASPDAAMLITRSAMSVRTRLSPVRVDVMPMPSMAKTVAKIPIEKISEWAKLMSRSTPYTSV